MIKPTDGQSDPLTGLTIRKVAAELFEKALAEAKGERGDAPLAVVLFDIDRFKSVNERYGHLGGDNALLALVDILHRVLPANTLAARYGGDEFLLLMPDKEREQVFLMMEQVRQTALQATFLSERGETVTGVSISVGVAAFPIDGRTTGELLRKADQALYRAKGAGRSQIRLAYEERMVPKTTHYTQTQLERLTALAATRQVSEADLLREAMDDLLTKYHVNEVES